MTIKIDITGGQPTVHLETNAENTAEAADAILAALEAREPDEDIGGFFFCPSCKSNLTPAIWRHCPMCGQRIKWKG